jgi:PAS domain S-box-containing protein
MLPNDDRREVEEPSPPASIPAVPDPGVVVATATVARVRDGESRRAIDRRVLAVVEGMAEGFLTIGPTWHVTYANREAARLIGRVPGSVVSEEIWSAWSSAREDDVEQCLRRAAAAREPVHCKHHDATIGAWLDIRAYPADDGGVALFVRDITAAKELEAERTRHARALADAHDEAIAAETQFRLFVDRVRDYAVFILDPDGIITHWGVGAERIERWPAAEIIGCHLRVLYPGHGSSDDGTAEEHLRHAAKHGEYIGEGMRERRGGEPFPARVVLTALRRGGRLVGFSNITQDLTSEREREAALTAAVDAARAANRAKSEFLATMSHELRTPLNAAIGYSELLAMGLAGPLGDVQRQYVARIQEAARHLLSLVNDVLDLSKVEAGQMVVAREAALARDAIRAALRLVEPQANARRIALVDGCRDDDTTAYGADPARVRQIIANLLSNAVRFTEPGGRVTVSCGSSERASAAAAVEGDGPWTSIRVEDTGVGIDPAELERIWDAFIQLDAGRTRKTGGSGLGLTISRYLARLMGGDITVWSEPGLGSSFVLWLPSADAREVRADALQPTPAALLESSQDPQVALAELDVRGSVALHEIADALLSEVERVMATYLARLRRDPLTPSAHVLGDSQVEDHTVTFLADLSRCLQTVAADGPDAAAMLRDGSMIQRLIAVRHGRQRARLGWAEAEVRRDFRILREEVHAAILRRSGTSTITEADRAIAIINHFLDAAERETIDAFRASEAGE